MTASPARSTDSPHQQEDDRRRTIEHGAKVSPQLPLPVDAEHRYVRYRMTNTLAEAAVRCSGRREILHGPPLPGSGQSSPKHRQVRAKRGSDPLDAPPPAASTRPNRSRDPRHASRRHRRCTSRAGRTRHGPSTTRRYDGAVRSGHR
jgi:hypothetical protein